MSKILFHVTLVSNISPIMEVGLVPQLGERAIKLETEKAGVFLFPSYEELEDAMGQWLGEEFEEVDEEIVSLKIVLPDDFPLEQEVGWEMISRIPIDPEYISFFKNEG